MCPGRLFTGFLLIRQEVRAIFQNLQSVILLSQDEARFPLVPTLCTTLGVKGQRPLVGTWDNKDLVYCFAALNLVTGPLTTRLLEQPSHSKAKTGRSNQQRLQAAFAGQLRDIARAYPASTYAEVVITIDNAPWCSVREPSIRIWTR